MVVHKGVKWRKHQGALIPDAPPHQSINISDADIRYLLKTSGAYLLRWVTDFDHDDITGFWFVIKDSRSSLDELSGNTRSKIRRGLKKCTVKKVDKNIIASSAYDVYKKAFDRYKTDIRPIDQKSFVDYILNMDESQWDFWAVRDNNHKLIAYSQNRVSGNSCTYSTIKFDPSAMKLYPSYALFYEMNNHYLNKLRFGYVNDGARSIRHDTNIQKFLIDKYKFRKAYSDLHIAYRLDVKIIIVMTYPLRSVIGKFNNNLFNKLSALLLQEQIRRSCG